MKMADQNYSEAENTSPFCCILIAILNPCTVFEISSSSPWDVLPSKRTVDIYKEAYCFNIQQKLAVVK